MAVVIARFMFGDGVMRWMEVLNEVVDQSQETPCLVAIVNVVE
jgi:hypothetical protein